MPHPKTMTTGVYEVRVHCPLCHGDSKQKAAYCPSCKTIVVSDCVAYGNGEAVPSELKYCPACGAKFIG